jgi:hypothetical protein
MKHENKSKIFSDNRGQRKFTIHSLSEKIIMYFKMAKKEYMKENVIES